MYESLFDGQNGLCGICGRPLSEDRYYNRIDHIVRKSEGGKWREDNLRLIHLTCDWEREGNKPNSPEPEIAHAYRVFKLWQGQRQSYNNMITALTGDKIGTTASPYIDAESLSILMDRRTEYETLEKQAISKLRKLVRAHPVGKFLLLGPGMAHATAGLLLSKLDIRKADTVSSVWKFFGFVPEQAAGQEGRNPGLGALRAPLYAIPWATTALGRYNEFYRAKRAKGLNHGQASQRTIKLWLSHVWEVWRTAERLTTTAPYANNHLGHDNFASAEEYGWPN